MSFERSYPPCVRLLSVLAVVMVVTVSGQADDTWHNVYHSLKRFFTGKSSATPFVHHRMRRSQDRERANPSPASTPAAAENAPSPGASATPRVVILPATSPAPDATPATENPVRAPEATVTPEPSPQVGTILRSLSGPTPTVLPSPTPASGNPSN
jgi:hypothetical protein